MARAMASLVMYAIFILFLIVVVAEGAPKKPKKVKCKDKRFSQCYKKDLFCPDSCLRTCVVDCATCQPVCTPPPPPPPPPPPSPPPPPRQRRRSPPPPSIVPSPPPTLSSPPPPTPLSNSPPPPPLPPSIVPSPPPTLSSPPPPTPLSNSPPPTIPITPPSSSPPPPTTPSLPPPPPSSEAASLTRARCRKKDFPDCFGREMNCPVACPNQCEVDCVTCSPVCDCNKLGAVCQDPRFVGGDGITFYFHGKKDREFCLVSDSNLHINGHFIGKRNGNMTRDFTWVQSVGVLFNTHQLSIAAKKTATWDDSIDRLSLSFNGEPIILSNRQGAKWRSIISPGVTITRSRDTNAVIIEAEGNFKIKATVVPITLKESRVHNYGITDEDCFAHLDLSFKFYALSGDVSGVLGQTYASNYMSRVKMGVAMPVLGGEKEFAASSLFATDCVVARFKGQVSQNKLLGKSEFGNMNCGSGLDGRGVVCKR